VIHKPGEEVDRSDIDTDQIVPKQFLKRIDRTGYSVSRLAPGAWVVVRRSTAGRKCQICRHFHAARQVEPATRGLEVRRSVRQFVIRDAGSSADPTSEALTRGMRRLA
jgi:hypothetical protein